MRADREFSFGDLSVDILATRLLAYQYGLGDEKPTNYAGRHSYPNWRGEADMRFQWRDFTFIWTTDYVGSTDEESIYALPGDESVTNVAEADDRFFHNLSIRYRDPNRRFQVIVGVRNVFDVSPPVVGWSGFSPSTGTAVGYNIPLGSGYSLFDRRISPHSVMISPRCSEDIELRLSGVIMRRVASSVVLTLLLYAAAGAALEPPTLEEFAMRPLVRDVDLSPSGEHLAIMRLPGPGQNYVVDIYETARLGQDPYTLGADTWTSSG